MNAPVRFVAAAACAGGFAEQARAVRVCNRFGRCWMTFAHAHRRFYGCHRQVYRYGWRRPYYGYGRHWG